MRYKHKEQLYLLVQDCPTVCSFTLTPTFSVNYWLLVFNTIILSINYKKMFTSGQVCWIWLSVWMTLVITKKESLVYMGKRKWIWLKFHILCSDLSLSRTSLDRTTRLLLLYLPPADAQILPSSNRKSQRQHQGTNEQSGQKDTDVFFKYWHYNLERHNSIN